MPFLEQPFAPSLHSIVLIDGNLLIFLRKNFRYLEDSRQPNRQLSVVRHHDHLTVRLTGLEPPQHSVSGC